MSLYGTLGVHDPNRKYNTNTQNTTTMHKHKLTGGAESTAMERFEAKFIGN